MTPPPRVMALGGREPVLKTTRALPLTFAVFGGGFATMLFWPKNIWPPLDRFETKFGG